MSKVCKPTTVAAHDLLEIVKENNKRIRLLKKRVFREDSEFCVFCMTYLFTDTPDVECMMCDVCAHCYCVSCSKALDMHQEDGIPADGTCPTCYLGISNDYACGGKGKMESSEERPPWLDNKSLSLVVPKWMKEQELNNEKGRCALCYLDITTRYGKKRITKRDGKVFCGLCK